MDNSTNQYYEYLQRMSLQIKSQAGNEEKEHIEKRTKRQSEPAALDKQPSNAFRRLSRRRGRIWEANGIQPSRIQFSIWRLRFVKDTLRRLPSWASAKQIWFRRRFLAGSPLLCDSFSIQDTVRSGHSKTGIHVPWLSCIVGKQGILWAHENRDNIEYALRALVRGNPSSVKSTRGSAGHWVSAQNRCRAFPAWELLGLFYPGQCLQSIWNWDCTVQKRLHSWVHVNRIIWGRRGINWLKTSESLAFCRKMLLAYG